MTLVPWALYFSKSPSGIEDRSSSSEDTCLPSLLDDQVSILPIEFYILFICGCTTVVMSVGFDSAPTLVEVVVDVTEVGGPAEWHVDAWLIWGGRRYGRRLWKIDVVASDCLPRSDCCRNITVTNQLILVGRCIYVCMHSRECIYKVMVLSGRVFDYIFKGRKQILLPPELLAIWCSLY